MGWAFERRPQQFPVVWRVTCARVQCMGVGGGCALAGSGRSESLPPHSLSRLPSRRNFVITSSLGLKQTQHSTALCNLLFDLPPGDTGHEEEKGEGGRPQRACVERPRDLP